MKNERQQQILKIISGESIDTQEQLLARLQELGIKSTQATISRDIKALHLVKEPTGQGGYRYAASNHRSKLKFADKLRNVFRESVLSVDYAQNIAVIKTMPGLAQAAGSALDGMDYEDVVGTVAGDDTVILVMRTTASAVEFCNQVKEMLR